MENKRYFADTGVLFQILVDKDTINFCLKNKIISSPAVLEEFLFVFIYKPTQEIKNILRKAGFQTESTTKRRKELIKYLPKILETFSLIEFVSVPPESKEIVLAEKVLEKLTKDVKTMDILHVSTAILCECDYFMTNDKKLKRWLSKNSSNIFGRDMEVKLI